MKATFFAVILIGVVAAALAHPDEKQPASKGQPTAQATTAEMPAGLSGKKVDEASKGMKFQAANAPLDPKLLNSTFGGACYLQRPPGDRICVNSTYSACANSAKACGCTFSFAAGKSC